MALTQNEISKLYVSIFNRASEGEGNEYWSNFTNLEEVANKMLETKDAQDYFGNSVEDNQDFIEHIYYNTLNKTIEDDAEGIAYWVKQLNEGLSKGELIVDLINAVEDYKNTTDITTQNAYLQFNNRVDISDYISDSIYYTPTNYKLSTSFSEALSIDYDTNYTYSDIDDIINEQFELDERESVTEIQFTSNNELINSDWFEAYRTELDDNLVKLNTQYTSDDVFANFKVGDLDDIYEHYYDMDNPDWFSNYTNTLDETLLKLGIESSSDSIYNNYLYDGISDLIDEYNEYAVKAQNYGDTPITYDEYLNSINVMFEDLNIDSNNYALYNLEDLYENYYGFELDDLYDYDDDRYENDDDGLAELIDEYYEYAVEAQSYGDTPITYDEYLNSINLMFEDLNIDSNNYALYDLEDLYENYYGFELDDLYNYDDDRYENDYDDYAEYYYYQNMIA